MGTEVGAKALEHSRWGQSPGPALWHSGVPCALGLSHFHQHIESVEVEQGGVARFQCLIQGMPEPSISWEHNGTALDPDFCVLRVTLLPGGILHITSVSQADVGTYHCVAHNVANTRHCQGAQLTLTGEQGLGESEWASGRGGHGELAPLGAGMADVVVGGTSSL